MSEPIVSLRGLVKRYGAVVALDGVDAELPRGTVGLLGPNGAGKTTLLKVLLGLLVPQAGEVRIAGADPRTAAGRLAVRRSVGYMPEGDCLMPEMTGVELVAALGRITGLSREDAMMRSHEVLDYVELEEVRYRPLDDYSTGMKQRLKLAQALVHDPDLLLLDEPTNGLDPRGRRDMLDLIRDLGEAQGKSVVLCSHLLHDVERTCEFVVILNKGRVVRTDSIAAMTGGDGLRLRVAVEGPREDFARRLTERGYKLLAGADGELAIELDSRESDADPVFEVAAEVGAAITRLDEVRMTLEEVFLKEMLPGLDPARAEVDVP